MMRTGERTIDKMLFGHLDHSSSRPHQMLSEFPHRMNTFSIQQVNAASHIALVSEHAMSRPVNPPFMVVSRMMEALPGVTFTTRSSMHRIGLWPRERIRPVAFLFALALATASHAQDTVAYRATHTILVFDTSRTAMGTFVLLGLGDNGIWVVPWTKKHNVTQGHQAERSHIPATSIGSIVISRRNKLLRSQLIWTGTGAAIGGLLGYAKGDTEQTQVIGTMQVTTSTSATEHANLGILVGATLGLLTGTVIGMTRTKVNIGGNVLAYHAAKEQLARVKARKYKP
jgi:hypothetical protein